MPRQRGFILIIVLALLGVLAFIALEFAQRSQVTRNLSTRYVHKSKAALAARSGLEKAVVATRFSGLRIAPAPPLAVGDFQRMLDGAGEDRNRNGTLDSGEDLNGNTYLDTHMPLAKNRTPSLALSEVETGSPQSLVLTVGDSPRGVSWVDSRQQPGALCSISLKRGYIDLNAGIESGAGAEGKAYETDFGTSYSSSSISHPFNEPLVRLLNSWGNYHKYRAMVRPGKTYTLWNMHAIDDLTNMASSSSWSNPITDPNTPWDVFYPSERCPAEPPLGNLLVLARPPGGYKDLGIPMTILDTYLRSWGDRLGNDAITGTWLRTNGTAIDPLTETAIKRIKDEFESLSVLDIPRHPMLIFKRTPPPASEVDASLYEIDTNGVRNIIAGKRYRVMTAVIDINTAPESVLAALIYGMGNVWYHQLSPINLFPWGRGENNYVLQCDNNDDSSIFSLTNSARISENNYPYGFHTSCFNLAAKPIFSMTESIALATYLSSGRTLFAHTSYDASSGLMAKIREWEDGYDGKITSTSLYDTHYRYLSAHLSKFVDTFRGNHRETLLAHLLNPHTNSNYFTFDEALPRAMNNRINGIGDCGSGVSAYGAREFHVRHSFDKLNTHSLSGWISTGHGSFNAEVLGDSLDANGQILASSRITAPFHAWTSLDIWTQKDFNICAKDPSSGVSTLGNDWVTYPEPDHLPPADWDGKIALKPRFDPAIADPFGSNLRARVPLTMYATNPTEDTEGNDLWPEGPRVVPGAIGQTTCTLRNSLQPTPGAPFSTALFPGSFAAMDSASDLMPGGGIRVWPIGNSIRRPASSTNDPQAKEAVLTLRNQLVSDGVDGSMPDPGVAGASSWLLPSFREGAVSFRFKPLFPLTLSSTSGYPRDLQLFFLPFVVEDLETKSRCAALGAPFNAQQDLQKWYTGHISLSWSGIPAGGKQYRYNALPTVWPQIANGLPNPYQCDTFGPGFGQTPVLTTPFLFANMNGVPLNGGAVLGNVIHSSTRLNGGTSSQYLFGPASPVQSNPWVSAQAIVYSGMRGLYNPTPNESLILEVSISKYADLSPTFSGGSLYPDWGVWDPVADDMTVLGKSGAYVNPAATPLYLFDTTDATKPEHHAVRKTFILNHPINPANGRGPPTDNATPPTRLGPHQAMLVPGRWNHIVVAWRNMWKLLDNRDATHQGGCLAVYLNGTFSKTSNTYQTQGLLLQSDFSEAYFMGGSPPDMTTSTWSPAFHPVYQVAPYNFRCKSSILPSVTGPVGVGWQLAMPYSPGNEYALDKMPWDSSYSRANWVALSPPIYTHLPSRFYFGCRPQATYTLSDSKIGLFPTAIISGAFMDVQIFERPAASICAGDGGFNPNPAGYDGADGAYPNKATLDLYPLNMAKGQTGRILGVRWTAHLPEFHWFWDEQSNLAVGPDKNDSQQLRLEVFVNGEATPRAVLAKSQDPTYRTYVDTSYGMPGFGVTGSYEPVSPPFIGSSQGLKCRLAFKCSEDPFPVDYINNSTPLLENLEVLFAPTQPLIKYVQIE